MQLENLVTGYGRPVLDDRTDGPLPRLRWWTIPHANRRILLRDGSVGFNLIHFATWWNESLHSLAAPLDKFDEWGYANRVIAGSNTTSEHAGGCAVDLDATRHPRGVPILRTFSAYQARRIRNRLRLYDGTIGWGGDYHRIPDGMHFEFADGYSLASAEKVARKLLTSPRGLAVLGANPGAREVILS